MKIICCCLVLLLCACSPAPQPLSHEDVNRVVVTYIGANNARDAGKAMSMIQKAPDVVSITGAKVTRGWDAINDATQRSLRQPNAPQIQLGDLEVWTVGPDAALASGTMRLAGGPFQIGERKVEFLNGAFTFLVKRTPEGLRITHEHFSIVLL
jgi:ketosteroid isomerase-like protein